MWKNLSKENLKILATQIGYQVSDKFKETTNETLFWLGFHSLVSSKYNLLEHKINRSKEYARYYLSRIEINYGNQGSSSTTEHKTGY